MAEAPPITEPTHHLSRAARWVWRLYWTAGSIALLVACRVFAPGLPDGLDPVLWAVPLLGLLVGAPVVPELSWRRWRWEVREDQIDLMRGVLVLRRTLIPMARVQHVETSRGVIGQMFGLATVEVHTAAGSHTIPLLTEDDAGLLRNRIAELARTGDEPAATPEAPPLPDAG